MCIYTNTHVYEGNSINKSNIKKKKSKILFFQRNFFHKCKLWFLWNWFIVKVISIEQKYFFWGYLKWQQIKQSVPGLNRGLSLNFWWLKSANHMKFTAEGMICTEKYILLKNVKQMGDAWAHNYEIESKRQSIEWKHGFFGKETFLNFGVCKEGHADNLLRYERTYRYWFPYKKMYP